MKIMLSAGEASGDLNASFLARELKGLKPEVELLGMGGAQMAAEGVDILADPTQESVLGFVEVLRSLPKMKRLLRQLEAALAKERPDCLVLVDFPGFNMKLAQRAHALGIPVVYYFAPSAWVWGRGRAKKVARYCQLVLSVFPKEAEVYREAGARVASVGHPLVEIVQAKDCSLQQLGLEDAPFVALLPGSRPSEIKNLMPQLLAAAKLVKKQRPDLQFVIALSSSIPSSQIQEQVAKLPFPVKIITGSTYELLAKAEAAVIAVGTATLEAALLGTPMVIVYRIGILTGILARLLVKTPYLGLPNILAGEELVPELLQSQVQGERIAQELLKFLEKDQRQLRQKLLALGQKLGNSGAPKRAAEEIIGLLEGGKNTAHSHYSQ